MPFQKKYKTDEQRKKAINDSNNAYHKRSMRSIGLRFHKKTDAEILRKLDSVSNKTDYVRKLILNDISKKD